jgi:peptidoglycan hydrolase CwlO-like protein
VEIALYNMYSVLTEIETGQVYKMAKANDIYSGLGQQDKVLEVKPAAEDEAAEGQDQKAAEDDGEEGEKKDLVDLLAEEAEQAAAEEEARAKLAGQEQALPEAPVASGDGSAAASALPPVPPSGVFTCADVQFVVALPVLHHTLRPVVLLCLC